MTWKLLRNTILLYRFAGMRALPRCRCKACRSAR
jgi:hypothetical protein